MNSASFDTKICNYCKKPGHFVASCPKLEKKDQSRSDIKPVINYVFKPADVSDPVLTTSNKCQQLFQPFRFEGSVSASEAGPSIPVSILRDTGASHSIVVRSIVPFVEDLYTGEFVVLKGINECTTLPLCRLYLKAGIISQVVTVAVQDSLPVEGVTFLLGNDIAGCRIIPDPVVCSNPLTFDPAVKLTEQNPGLFPSCIVTRSQSMNAVKDTDVDLDLDKVFPNEAIHDEMVEEPVSTSSSEIKSSVETGDVPVTREMLVEAQRADPSLGKLLDRAVSEAESEDESVCYFLKSSILMRKFHPPEVPKSETWHIVTQIVVPTCYRDKVLSLAHDHIGGHLGVKKTLYKILKYFFWPGVSSDVAKFCKNCHICQIAGKPNQVMPRAPLQPIPVVSEPFHRVIIDCVGPLEKTRKGHQFLLTIMDTTTRYPEAVPLRSITTKSIIPVLIKFFTQFGLPKIVQSDQGTNFTSKIFKEVLASLGIKQHLASCYHPESQGALERFHQTLKSMLTKYCLESVKDWDEGVPLMLYAIRNTTQESLGFSPNELLFGRDVRGPLKLLHESWIDEEKDTNLSDYVAKLRDRLKHMQEFASENLSVAQRKMKVHHDVSAVEREFNVGDKVLLFLPIIKFPL